MHLYQEMIVNLPVVTQPQEWKLFDSQRLHAIQLVHNRQAMEAKTTVSEAINILYAKGIRSSVSDLHGTPALH